MLKIDTLPTPNSCVHPIILINMSHKSREHRHAFYWYLIFVYFLLLFCYLYCGGSDIHTLFLHQINFKSRGNWDCLILSRKITCNNSFFDQEVLLTRRDRLGSEANTPRMFLFLMKKYTPHVKQLNRIIDIELGHHSRSVEK